MKKGTYEELLNKLQEVCPDYKIRMDAKICIGVFDEVSYCFANDSMLSLVPNMDVVARFYADHEDDIPLTDTTFYIYGILIGTEMRPINMAVNADEVLEKA